MKKTYKRKKIIVHMVKFILWIVICVILLIVPLIIEKVIVNEKIFFFKMPESVLGNEQWFSFWGSYLGALITLVVMMITIKYNNQENRKMFEKYFLNEKYKELIKQVEFIHKYLMLEIGKESMQNKNELIYVLKLNKINFLDAIKQCISLLNDEEDEYFNLALEIVEKYQVEMDKIPTDDRDIKEKAEIYITCQKNIFRIMHKYHDKEFILYNELLKKIQQKHIETQKKILGF